MRLRLLVTSLTLSTLVAVLPALAADIVLTPPASGGVAVTNAAGTVTMFRVGEDGNLTLQGTTATTGTLFKGANRFIHNFGTENTFIGVLAGNLVMSGAFNTASGASALQANMAGNNNSAIGYNALTRNSTGNSNTAIGRSALTNNTIGNNNIAIGDRAGENVESGNYNINIGNDGGPPNESNTIRIGKPGTHTDTLLVGNVNIEAARVVNFGSTTRQMLNLWSTTYGIGIQDLTQYFRTQYAYAWYQGGVHSNAQLTPGAGGETLMALYPAAAIPPVLPAVTGHLRVQALTQTSDRNAKEAFEAVDGKQVLASLVRMPLNTWKYRNESASVRHIGPTAQDFRANFGVGYDDKTIATVDADGVALAAIQGLYEVVAEKDRRIAALEAKTSRLDALERELGAIKQALGLR